MKKIILLLVTFCAFSLAASAGIAPTAKNISMAPIVQASNLLPLEATAVNSEIVMYTIETAPAETQGTLYLAMASGPMQVTAGMMLSADLAGSLSFEPNTAFTGTVTFTYSAIDANMEQSNIASYSIPVIAQQPVILPVQLMGFRGSLQQHTARLFWQTSQESEGAYYELQRSTDGTRFSTIATVAARGAAGVQEYSELDDVYAFSGRTLYYRIKMVEVNGQGRYSAQITLRPGTTANPVKAWPLPFQSQLQISYQATTAGPVLIRVTAANGMLLQQIRVQAQPGSNQWPLHQLSQLPAGSYVLSITEGTQTHHLPILKN